MDDQSSKKVFQFALCSLFVVAIAACSGSPKMDEARGDAQTQMMGVYSCYMQYTNKNRKAPGSIEDLQPLLSSSGLDTSNILVSPRDGSELVVLWGVKPDVRSAEPVVFGYESQSHDGKRVAMTSMGVWVMSDEDFMNARFPAGHQAPAQ